MRTFDGLSAALVIVGAVNWLLVGTMRLDLVATLFGLRFGEVNGATSVVYALVGLAGLYQAYYWTAARSRAVVHA
jgi:uncharacterized protein